VLVYHETINKRLLFHGLPAAPFSVEEEVRTWAEAGRY